VRGGGFADRSLKIAWQKTCVSVNTALAILGKDHLLEKRRRPCFSSAGVPQCEAKVFLAVISQEMPGSLTVYFFRHRHAV
jgi:hypothetical protein